MALNFSVIPDARLPEMADQVRRAIAWLYGNVRSFDGDPDQIYVSGHSSGGHLAGVLLTTDWREYDVPDTVIKGALCASGIFDLQPVLLSSRGSYVELSEEEEEHSRRSATSSESAARRSSPMVMRRAPSSSASPATSRPRSKKPGTLTS